jgi:hypothetical protein
MAVIEIRESLLVGRTSAELRACWLRWRFLPIARELFASRPSAQAIIEARLAISEAARERLERADPSPVEVLREALDLVERLPASPAARNAGPEAVLERRLTGVLERAAGLRREVASA